MNGTLNKRQFPEEFISVGEKDKLKLNKLQLDRNTAFSHLTITESVAGIQVTNGRWGSNLLNKSSNLNQVRIYKNLNILHKISFLFFLGGHWHEKF